jgi:hypothetical protein
MRARNIKPGFFKNEILVTLPFEYRLLFIGLWCYADKEGRFEDRPIKIKIDLFPCDNVDVDKGIQVLHESGFLTRYTHENMRFCEITAWSKHQHPHIKESESTIPAPCKHQTCTGLAPVLHHASPSDSLIPDSLIPDSLIPDSSEKPDQPSEPTKKDSANDKIVLPFTSEAFSEVWARWVSHRSESKKKLSPSTIKTQLAKLAKWGENRAIAALENSLFHGWSGIFEPQGNIPSTPANGKPQINRSMTIEQIDAQLKGKL